VEAFSRTEVHFGTIRNHSLLSDRAGRALIVSPVHAVLLMSQSYRWYPETYTECPCTLDNVERTTKPKFPWLPDLVSVIHPPRGPAILPLRPHGFTSPGGT
jgi:hypothetical protein